MLKKFFAFAVIGATLGCSQVPEGYRQCPLITIKREDARLIQIANYRDNFEVELKGVEAFCYFDKRVRKEKAKITPIFVVRKLRNTDETDVQFSWFTNTIKGPPEFLGKKSYFVGTSLKKGEKIKEFKGPQVEVKIPLEMMYEFEVFAGLNTTPAEKKYNQRFFDVDLGYYENMENEDYGVRIREYPAQYYEDGTLAAPDNLRQ